MALAPPVDKQTFECMTNKDFNIEQKSNVAIWELEGTRRIIESGFVLRAMIAKEEEHFIDNVKLLCINDWKITNYKVYYCYSFYIEYVSFLYFCFKNCIIAFLI